MDDIPKPTSQPVVTILRWWGVADVADEDTVFEDTDEPTRGATHVEDPVGEPGVVEFDDVVTTGPTRGVDVVVW